VPAADNSNVIEKLGSGIRKMYAEQDKYDFRRPRFIDGEIYFTAILRQGNTRESERSVVSRTNMNNKDLLTEALSERALSRLELQQKTGLTKSQVRYALSKLIEDKKVERIGKGYDPMGKYALLIDE
jgi:predicted HTH transcriptional regulator